MAIVELVATAIMEVASTVEVVATVVGIDLLMVMVMLELVMMLELGASGYGEACGYSASESRTRGRWKGCGHARMHPYPSSVVS